MSEPPPPDGAIPAPSPQPKLAQSLRKIVEREPATEIPGGDGALDKSRLEAFSDGVIAIIITIMVLELKAPHGADLGALVAVASAFLTYVLSFLYVAIYWHNHQHPLGEYPSSFLALAHPFCDRMAQ
jgi:hypothetical protein